MDGDVFDHEPLSGAYFPPVGISFAHRTLYDLIRLIGQMHQFFRAGPVGNKKNMWA